MIWIPSLNYSENRSLDYEITEFVNEVLADILTCEIEVHEDSKKNDGCPDSHIIEAISPRAMLRENPQKCEHTLYDLRELVMLPTIRFSLQPRYYFFLYQSIEWYVEIFGSTDDGVEERERVV